MPGMASGAHDREAAALEEPSVGGKRDPQSKDQPREVLTASFQRGSFNQRSADTLTSARRIGSYAADIERSPTRRAEQTTDDLPMSTRDERSFRA
jgi:hypothetical protein